ncbi:Ribonuclease H-like domain, partial [Trinorchestia longiramus]
VYRLGKENGAADALSRVCGVTGIGRLQELHENLCHPGVTRMVHFIRGRNLPYSIEKVRRMTKTCPVCSELKPQFHKLNSSPLIKATQLFKTLNVDFKGPLPSTLRNKYMLVIIDEYFRFPFVFPCPDVSAESMICCL